MKIYLRDKDPMMVHAWKNYFKNEVDVEISLGDIFSGPKADAIVSPSNSWGFMDGGIDLVYSERFGWDVQKRLQQEIENGHYGELPVGLATIITTNDKDFPYLISAPTMRVPMSVTGTVNAYLSFRAALVAVKQWNNPIYSHGSINSILCPGLGTAVGQLHFDVCAKQMFYAYQTVEKGIVKNFKTLKEAVYFHHDQAAFCFAGPLAHEKR